MDKLKFIKECVSVIGATSLHHGPLSITIISITLISANLNTSSVNDLSFTQVNGATETSLDAEQDTDSRDSLRKIWCSTLNSSVGKTNC